MAIVLIKRDITDLDYDARMKRLKQVMGELHAQVVAKTDAPDSPVHEGCRPSSGNGTDCYGFTAAEGPNWIVRVTGSIPTKPSRYGATIPVPQQLILYVEHRQWEREKEDPWHPIAWLGCLPAAVVTFMISGGAVYRRLFLDPGNSNYLTTTQSRWMFIGGLIAGVVVMVVVALILNLIVMGIRKGYRSATQKKPVDLDQLARDVAAQCDVTPLSLADLPEVT